MAARVLGIWDPLHTWALLWRALDVLTITPASSAALDDMERELERIARDIRDEIHVNGANTCDDTYDDLQRITHALRVLHTRNNHEVN